MGEGGESVEFRWLEKAPLFLLQNLVPLLHALPHLLLPFHLEMLVTGHHLARFQDLAFVAKR